MLENIAPLIAGLMFLGIVIGVIIYTTEPEDDDIDYYPGPGDDLEDDDPSRQ